MTALLRLTPALYAAALAALVFLLSAPPGSNAQTVARPTTTIVLPTQITPVPFTPINPFAVNPFNPFAVNPFTPFPVNPFTPFPVTPFTPFPFPPPGVQAAPLLSLTNQLMQPTLQQTQFLLLAAGGTG